LSYPTEKIKTNMAQQHQSSNYTHGYSKYTTSTHEARTTEVDAAFLLPHIKDTDHILDVGCGPGTITTGLAKYASKGKTIGIDISPYVLEKAKTLAADNSPSEGLGSAIFEQGNVLEKLSYPDNTFDVVFSSQVLGHLTQPGEALRALTEIRRVLKPGGVLGTRDGGASHFYPKSSDLDRLWGENQRRVILKGAPETEPIGSSMPGLLRSAGFDVDGGKVRIGAGTTIFSGAETRKWLAWRASGQLAEGDAFRQNWLDAGITEDEINQTVAAVTKWAETEDAWFMSLQFEMLAWK
jgi:ubiquinone/menaquinone biosynthesis C-methylase UbiE